MPAPTDAFTSERIAEAGAFSRLRPVLLRWVLPSTAAFLIGVVSMLVSLREQEREIPAITAAPATANAVPRDEPAPRSSYSNPVLLLDPAAAPAVATGPPALRDLRSLPRVGVELPPAPPAPFVRPAPTMVAQSAPRARPAPPSPATVTARRPERVVATRGDTAAALPLARPSAPAVDAAPIVPLVPSARGAGLPDAIVVEVPRLAGPAVEHAVLTSAGEESAVRRALLSYESAYDTLNVAAAAEVWPSVDRQRLARAFATLKSQGLEFQSCSIKVQDANATAYCRGTYEYVRKVGNPAPLLAEQQWVFKMHRAGGAWKIDDVSASQAAPLAAQRTRGQG